MLSENSHDIDEYEQSIIEGCLEMEAELGFLQRGEVQQPDADEAGHVQRLVETLRTAASEHEAMQRIPPPWDWDPSSHAFPGQTPKRKEHTMHGFQSAVRLEDDGRRATVQPSSSFPGHGLLDATHALDPEAWLDEVPQIINDPDEYGGGNVLPSVVDESKGGQGGQLSTPHVTKDVPKRKNMQDSGSDIVNHPYVRLPVLARGVVIRPIKVENLLISYNSKLRLDCSLDQLRRLFALRELDQEAVNELVTATEGLVGAVSYHAKKSLRNNRPVYAAEATGYNFLAFDALVCAIQLLGDYMNLPLWWEGFVAIFNRDPFSKMEPLKRRTGGMYRTLIVRLLEALDIYKTGKRPSLEEVIAIKDILFCSPRAPKAFKDPKWDPWLQPGVFRVLTHSGSSHLDVFLVIIRVVLDSAECTERKHRIITLIICGVPCSVIVYNVALCEAN
ncbi:hypothetical protein EMWEY_00011840 [Eimeria maxima]|uniref:Uncharacterized protein n=1 Tax=Eimeria maxima TaxID=5804 RepID=U6MBW5_EIMMA|nr:hypothetical protein EMWEY_00011840 [Eimeria maxima]CDJ61717.1 hypothetical protein EMWEY_00011840 [Eimeria maxima]